MTPKANYNLWTFKSKGDQSAFGGNEGYDDDPQSYYLYDTTVKNHDKVAVGDFVIIAGKKSIIGVSQIEKIVVETNVKKIRFRCPHCGNQEIYSRKALSPKFKCRKKHEFDEPLEQPITVTRFSAYYELAFTKFGLMDSVTLLPYFVNYNKYYSIQKTDISFLTEKVLVYIPNLFIKDINKDEEFVVPTTPYIPDNFDLRTRRFHSRPTREGQNSFRMFLFRIYGIRCMLTGCDVEKAIDASHINPYKGRKDNHPENGLLLRKDIHSLFDNNLLGINPDDLTIHFHPVLNSSHYEEFSGKRIRCFREGFSASKPALVSRWEEFSKGVTIYHSGVP